VYSLDEFGIKSEPSIEVKYTTTKDEGTLEDSKIENNAPSKTNVKQQDDTQNVVQPMGDLDVSSL